MEVDLSTLPGLVAASIALTGLIIWVFRVQDDREKKLLNLGVVVGLGAIAVITKLIDVPMTPAGIITLLLNLLLAVGINGASYQALKVRRRK